MEYKKTIILLALVVFLLSIAGVSASEIDNTIASENANTIELSTDNDIEDNLQTSEENEALASTDYDEALSTQTDTEVLGADSATYSDLAYEISRPGNINLIHKNYTYDWGETIDISEPNKVIDGNGAVIDMNGSTIRAFCVIASGVTIKNLTIKNANYNDYGGAIYFLETGNVTNCNFVNNTASGWGGAIRFSGTGAVTNCNFTGNTASINGGGAITMGSGTVSNCNFVDNKATGTNSWGGAVYFQSTGSLTNCNFTNNKATGTGNYDGGGAVYFQSTGTVANCNFTDNTATEDGGAIYFLDQGTVTNCNFTNNKATRNGGAVYFNHEGTVSNCNFTDNTASEEGGAVYFNGMGDVSNCNFTGNTANDDGGAVYFNGMGDVSNCNFTNNSAQYGGAVCFVNNGTVTNCNFTGNTATYNGGAINMGSGTVSNCNFTGNTGDYGGAIRFSGSGNVSNCNFVDNKATGDGSWGGAIYIYSGTVSNCNFTDNTASRGGGAIRFSGSGNVSNCNFTDNTASRGGGAIRFSGSGNVSNCNFTGNTAGERGGAVYFEETGTVTNCNFTGNTADYGGAVFFNSNGEVTNCNFTGNTADYGGAVYFDSTGTVSNCNFTGNNATTGSAIYFSKWVSSDTLTVSNSTFLNNRANAGALDVVKNDNNIIITFTGQNNLLNAIYSRNDAEVTFTNVTYWGAKGITTVSAKLSGSNKAAGQNITVKGVVNGKIIDKINGTDENGEIVLDDAGDYWIIVSHKGDLYYTEIAETLFTNMKLYANVTSLTTNNKTVNITAKSNIPQDVVQGKLLFILLDGTEINATYGGNGTWWAMHKFADYSVYQVNATYEGLDNVTITNGTISISKTPTNITVENETLELFVKDYIATGATLTPADAGNLTFTSSNITVVEVKDGIIEAVGEGSAIITVSFAGSDDYAAADNKTISVTVSLKNASVSVNNATLDLLIGDEFTIVATTDPKGLDVTFTPDNSGVISVDDSGVVTALREGNATVKVKVGGDGVYALNTTDVTVTVKKIPTNITVKNATLELYVEDSIATGVTLTPADAGNVTYTVSNSSVVKVEDGTITAIGGGTAIITVSFAGNDNYTAAENKTITVNVIKYDSKVIISPINATVYSNNVTIKYAIENKTNVTVTIDGVSDDKIIITNDTITVIGLDAGVYTITVFNSESSIYYKSNDTKTFTVNKQATSITAADVSTTYNINKDLVITLKDANGNPLTGASVTVDLNGAKTYTTDKNGQVKVSTKGLAPKAYTAKITFNANTNYDKSTKNVKVTIKKATPKLTAKKKTFKTTPKTKKYTITLKDNTGKAIKKAKVTLKVKGKTYKATTNRKGKAVFKIKNLKKKGTFKATITYKGNKYYNKISKKAKIKVIVTFKTVSKGSKDKATVKEIQQALKDKGYYLTYQGHYLKVDGKFKGCTERSLKEFQKDNGLKVTGKVDEKTAKKLGIL